MIAQNRALLAVSGLFWRTGAGHVDAPGRPCQGGGGGKKGGGERGGGERRGERDDAFGIDEIRCDEQRLDWIGLVLVSYRLDGRVS